MVNIDKTQIIQSIENCINFLKNNSGNTKPNACNADGIPYHAYDENYHWKIAPLSTTSECLTLMIRALTLCGDIEYAEQLANYTLTKLTHANLETIHWLVNLVDSGVEMESVMCGAADNSVFSFTNGVGLIPAGTPFYGERTIPKYQSYATSRYNGIRGCFSGDAVFPWKDYWIENKTGLEYKVEDYRFAYDFLITNSGEYLTLESGEKLTSECIGTEITLIDKTVNASLQVFHAYRNGIILNKDELYRTYPMNEKCVRTPNTDFQLSCATDAIQWAIIALKDLYEKTGNIYYINKANSLRNKLIEDMTIKTKDYYLFDTLNRGLIWYAVGTYDETKSRNVQLFQQDKYHTRFSFTAGAGTISWSIGNAFVFSTETLELKARGDNSGSIRQVVLVSKGKEYRFPWVDNEINDRIVSCPKNQFSALDNVFFEGSRINYLEPYGASGGSYSIAKVSHLPDSVDADGIKYPICHRYNFSGAWNVFGTSHIEGIASSADYPLRFTMAGSKNIQVFIKIIDANNVARQTAGYIPIDNTLQTFELDWSNFPGTVAHPVKNIEFVVNNDSGSLYLYSILVGGRKILADTDIDVIKFETRQATAGFFDLTYAKINEGRDDLYPYAGVPTFSVEYTELGLMGWRAGTYSGYTNPYTWLGSNNDLDVSLKFLYDAQIEYERLFDKKGPFVPHYLRNLGENRYYGELGEWTWVGPDPNTFWAGFQYRSLANVADTYFKKDSLNAFQIGYCSQILNKWTSFLYYRLKTGLDIPSDYQADGRIEANYISPDFYALVGRAMLLKALVDGDKRAVYVMERMYEKLITLQQVNGSFYYPGADIYNFHQAEVLTFLAQLKDYVDNLEFLRGLKLFDFKPKIVYTSSIEFRTKIFESFKGKEQRQSETRYPIRTWKLEFEKHKIEKQAVQSFFNGIGGRYNEFQWVWESDFGGDGNIYSCRLTEDDLNLDLDIKGYGKFTLTFIAIDTNDYPNNPFDFAGFTPKYKGKISRKTVIDNLMTANVKTYQRWLGDRKSWTLEFDKNLATRQLLEQFFIAKKGKLKSFEFLWLESMGGDGNTYRVRFDTDVLDFEIGAKGYGKFQLQLVEVL